MSSTPAAGGLDPPRWRERRRITRAGRRDRVMYRGLPFDEHTPWTRQLLAHYAALAIDARRLVLDRRDELEQERDRLHAVLAQPRSARTAERPTDTSDTRERHRWATQTRRLAEEAERVRRAQVRLTAISAELQRLAEREVHVLQAHEQAFLLRAHRYNAARAVRATAAAAAAGAPPFSLPSPVTAHYQPSFDYITAA